jgi:hypothetical protein
MPTSFGADSAYADRTADEHECSSSTGLLLAPVDGRRLTRRITQSVFRALVCTLMIAGVWIGLQFRVAATPVPLTAIGPVNVWVGLTNSDDVGIRFDLKAEIYRNTTLLLGSGELASVQGGSSGFNNAHLQTIPLTLVSGQRSTAATS